jgi:hypothetical protein
MRHQGSEHPLNENFKVGAAEFRGEGVKQLCDRDNDGHVDNEPVMPSGIVLNYGFERELPIGGGAGL